MLRQDTRSDSGASDSADPARELGDTIWLLSLASGLVMVVFWIVWGLAM